MDPLIRIADADPASPDIVALIRAHNAHGDAHYPAESNHHLTPDDYANSDVRLLAAWEGARVLGMLGMQPIGLRRAELKSMHVLEAARGKGVGAALLNRVLELAQADGLGSLWLETGSREGSAAARGLYESRGFRYCPPFGEYEEDPESVFMTLTL